MAPLRLLPALAAAAAAGCAIQFEASAEYEETFAPGGASGIAIEGVEGDVVIRGMDVDSLMMRGTRRAVGATEREARRRLGRARLDASSDGAVLALGFSPPLGDVGLVELELDRASTIPAALGLSVELESGDVDLSGLSGALDLRTRAGDIGVEDPGGGAVSATADDGRIEYALASTDFRIECEAGEGGAVLLDAALQSLVDSGDVERFDGDGVVVLTAGSGAKAVSLLAPAGDIGVSLLSR